MRLLLDTHVLLWALGQPAKLPPAVRASLTDPENDVYVSAASTWEIAVKSALGKLHADLGEVARAAAATGFAELPVKVSHTVRLSGLPLHHRDTFDRVLVAQAAEEGLTLVTRDEALARYGVAVLAV